MIWVNKRIPFKGYKAMAQYPILFVRKEYENDIDKTVMNHEKIHYQQQKGISLLIYDVWYVLEWLIRSITGTGSAYKNISFEKEAYTNQNNLDYIKTMKRFSFLKYM